MQEKISQVLGKLKEYSSVKIQNDLGCCRGLCFSKRNFTVMDTNSNVIFTAEEIRPPCFSCDHGYCLLYKLPNSEIFASLGYQLPCKCDPCCLCKICCSTECCCCCKKDCCNIYLNDIRMLNSEEAAKNIMGGIYMGTVKIPLNFCFYCLQCCFALKYTYTGAGSRFHLVEQCCYCSCGCRKKLDIVNEKNPGIAGEVIWTWPCWIFSGIFSISRIAAKRN